MPRLLFISDLHLSSSNQGTLKLFLEFLKSDALEADALYILGDLFDSWIGDDDTSEVANLVRAGLKTLSNQTRVCFQRGNRDFLVGELFAKQTGIQIVEDETVVELDGQRILLMHGDLLCTHDLDYQQARKTLHSQDFISDFLSKSLAERARLAAYYRQLSGEAITEKATDVTDVNQQTVRSFMLKHRADYLIHGHTHRPGQHRIELNNATIWRIVLSDWYGSYAQPLIYHGGHFQSSIR